MSWGSLTRQASVGRLMLCLCYFFPILSFFLTIAWSKEISKTTRPILTKFSAMVDMLV